MEVVTVDEAKKHLQIDADYTLMDDLILSFIKTAQEWCERYTGLSFTPKQLQMYTDRGDVELLYGPVQAIVSVKSNSDQDVQFTKRGLKHPWLYVYGPCTISYEAGYTPETLPEPIKTAVKMMVADLYQNRESFGVLEKGSVVTMPMGVKQLLQPYSRSGGLFL